MSRMLASVNSLNEALCIQAIGVDIIDLKQPSQGALGALSLQDVQHIVDTLNRSSPISATVGDLPMQADLITEAVKQMAATNVDYVKIGFFSSDNWANIIDSLQPLTQTGIKLIAVLFADQQPDIKTLPLFAHAGFKGIMLDTMQKNNGSLTQVMALEDIQHFVQLAKQYDLLCGLAGSLRISDIPILQPLDADYLGFRGALCTNQQRTECLDKQAVQQLKNTLCS